MRSCQPQIYRDDMDPSILCTNTGRSIQRNTIEHRAHARMHYKYTSSTENDDQKDLADGISLERYRHRHVAVQGDDLVPNVAVSHEVVEVLSEVGSVSEYI